MFPLRLCRPVPVRLAQQPARGAPLLLWLPPTVTAASCRAGPEPPHHPPCLVSHFILHPCDQVPVDVAPPLDPQRGVRFLLGA